MGDVFTNVGEFHRGKGNRKTRLGPRTAIIGETGRRAGRQEQTPDEIAYRKLKRALDRPGISKKARYQTAEFMRNTDQLRFMNMSVLAEVLVYMDDRGREEINASFSYNAILPYIERLLPQKEVVEGGIKTKEISDDEITIMRLRMAATFLRYIRYVLLVKEDQAYQLVEAQQALTEIQQ